MNILQLVSSARMSGAEKHVVVLSERLRQRGHTVVAVCPEGEWLPTQLRAAGIETIQMPMRGLPSAQTVLFLRRLVHDRNIDLIHAHLTRATYIGWLTGKITGLPVVSSVHCRTRDVAYRYLFPNRRNRILTVSDFIRDALVKQGIPPDRVRTIYNGTEFGERDGLENRGETSHGSPAVVSLPGRVRLSPEARAASGVAVAERPETEMETDANAPSVRDEFALPPNAELIGLFARVEEFKGHYVLAEAIPKIVAARPNAYFLCVGPVEPGIEAELREIAARDGLADRLRFTDVRNDVPRLMRAVNVVTLPSRYEACSMVIIEAMALGKPVVATRAGGNAELVRHGETGLLIERTPDALAEALVSILSASELRVDMERAALRRADAQFTARVMVNNIETLYREMIALLGENSS